ncbi:hypothetical protein Tsubulata_031783 [Turnera subulata]|uniref:DYW domain-containing protein n=1 Tax=Turnera subulata TaxID=218843 RepID=A0A9Q0FUJ9_9ROSI|nr:hypothetical protein Tsubulata_031783 [Turnera subulata]
MATATPTIFYSFPASNPTSTSISKPNHIVNLLKSCSNIREFSSIHAHLVTTNLVHDPQITTRVLHFLTSNNDPDYARQICGYTTEMESVIWNVLLETQLRECCPEEVFVTYYDMVTRGVLLDLTTFHYLIRACSKTRSVLRGSEVHCRILKSGFGRNKSLSNNLMGFYSKCGKLEEVSRLFRKLNHKDVISWNTMIACYVSVHMYIEALDLFDQMILEGVMPDKITMVSLVSACTKLRDLDMGRKLRVYIEESGIKIDGSLLNCLVDMYVKCGEMDEAHKLVARCHESGIDNVLWTSLVSGYAKSKKIDEARQLFDQMTGKSLISWTAMMSGLAQGGYYLESLHLFRQMILENVRPDEVAVVTALSACVHGEDFMLGRLIHGLIVKYGMDLDGFLGNALIDLYAKSEKVLDAYLIFEHLPWRTAVTWNSMLDAFCRDGDTDKTVNFFGMIPEKDIVSWNTIINFFVKHGMIRKSFELFREMLSSDVKPDKTTLINRTSGKQEVAADASSHHSEKLAVAFGLITSDRGNVPIRVANSVRICQDCHSTMKLMSQVYDREIVIRDNYRFHRFKGGHCSCEDFW